MPANIVEYNDQFHYTPAEEDTVHGSDHLSYNEVVRLNEKWQYDADMERFLRQLPKVS